MLWLLLALFSPLTLSAPIEHRLHESMSKYDTETLLGVPRHRLHEAPPYDLTTPMRVTEDGRYVSHDLLTDHATTRRIDMTADHAKPIHFNFTAFGKTFTLEVKTDTTFVSSSFFFELRGDERSIINHDVHACHYSGTVKSHPHVKSRVVLENCNGTLGGAIMMEGNHMIIQPLPDHLVEGEHSHIVTKRGSGMTGNDEDGVQMPTATSDPPTSNKCLVAPTTTPGGTASLTPDPRLEPINVFCDTSNDTLAEELKPKVENYTCNRIRPESLAEASKRLHVIESIIVIDHVSYNKHGKNLESLFTYIIRLVHIASGMYRADQLDFNVRLILKRCIVFKTKADEEKDGLQISQNSKTNLESFSAWQAKINNAGLNHPLHHDHAFLLTGNGMCFGREEDCWELGRAWIGGVCTDRFRASVNSDKGLQIGFVLAHELGHNLGMLHDGSGGQCRSSDGFVMAPSVSGASQIFKWSQCSKGYVFDRINNGDFKCLENCVSDFKKGFGQKHYQFPGKWYTLDEQCNLAFPGSKFCSFINRDICQELWCQLPNGRCTTTYVGATDGTPCGSPVPRPTTVPIPDTYPRICYNRQCFDAQLALPHVIPGDDLCSQPCVDDGPTVDGQWGPWASVGDGSATCGVSFVREERKCDSPPPSKCGFPCEGDSKRLGTRRRNPCPTEKRIWDDMPDKTRAEACRKLGIAKGVSDLKPYPIDKTCTLVCISESTGTLYRNDSVEELDGLRCHSHTNDRCFNGSCVPVGCDDVIFSEKKYDNCGVCNGSGSSCFHVNCTFSPGIQQATNDFFPIHTIPACARLIIIKEFVDSRFLYLTLSHDDGERVVIGGTGGETQIVHMAGTTFWYHRHPEVIVGALSTPTICNVTIEALIYGAEPEGCQPGFFYSYIMPNSTDPPPQCTKYVWSQKESPCSKCGPGGTQTPVVECRRTNDGVRVKESRCSDLPKPRPREQTCCGECKRNEPPCPQNVNFKWITKKYSECNETCGGGTQTRRVVCRDLNTGKNIDEYNCCKLNKKSASKQCNTQAC